MTPADRRTIANAIREYDHQRDEAGRALLVKLAGEFAPAKPTPVQPAAAPTLGLGVTVATAQPKRRRRLVDEQQRRQFKQDNPRCATPGSDCQGPITYSHLEKRSHCGPDANHNALPQCMFHHEVYERSPHLWWDSFAIRLAPPDRAKVLHVHPEFAEVARG